MRKIKIAILDSGISDELINNIDIIGKKSFYYNYYDEIVISDENVRDLNGHGTMCIDTIINEFENVEFYVIKMLNVSGVAHKAVLVEALRYARELDVDIITVCSSLCDAYFSDELKDICDEIAEKEKITVVSVENMKHTSKPASYKSVLGVIGGILRAGEFCFDENNEIQMQCSSEAAIVRSEFSQRSFFQGNSRAAALATAYVARIMYYNQCNYSDVYHLLTKKSKSNQFHPSFNPERDHILYIPFDLKKEEYLINNDICYHRFLYSLCEFFMCSETEVVRTSNLIELDGRYILRKMENFLSFIEERFSVELNNLKLEKFQWAYLFYEKYIMKK